MVSLIYLMERVMTHVITGGCCNDAACVAACPVNCIHPTPEERAYASSEMLYIDPEVCIDCGACADVCPVDAVVPDFELEPADEPFLELNAAWYADPARASYPTEPVRPPALASTGGPLRVAVVGAGPSASYVVEALLAHRGLEVEVAVLERLATAGGLVRYGVAPDHPATRAVGGRFARVLRGAGVSLHHGVEVGRDVTLDELRSSCHAVIVATGADGGRRLGVPGEDLLGSHSAADFVGWYNGHPDHAERTFDLTAERAVVVGNGNVALDVARILLSDVEALRRTDIAPAALEALASSSIREVVVVGRRGPEHAAFTAGELVRLGQTDDVRIAAPGLAEPGGDLDPVLAFKIQHLRTLDARDDAAAPRRVEFQFGRRVVRVVGEDGVRSLVLEGALGEEEIETGLVLSAIGFRPTGVPGLPADANGVVPNEEGRVHGLEGVFVAGWLKRGPSGGIGTNKWCARETVAALVADHERGALRPPDSSDADRRSLFSA